MDEQPGEYEGRTPTPREVPTRSPTAAPGDETWPLFAPTEEETRDLPAPAADAATRESGPTPVTRQDASLPGGPVRKIGKYQVSSEIARGGVGVVYHAFDPELRREVALKVLLVGAKANPAQLKRFNREGVALARLRHANIVSVHEVGEQSGCPYLVMDYIPGESLQDRLDRQGHLPIREAADITRKLALAVEFAHGSSVLHRDLKPSNVLQTPEGEPLLTDFGLAKTLDPTLSRLTASGMLLGTPGFWSPEHVSGKPDLIGPVSDVYGLGAVLYALLTRQPPFLCESLAEAVHKVQNSAPTRPAKLRRDLDSALEAICLRALEAEPDDRFPSAQALADALEEYLRQPPPQPRSRRSLALLVALPLVALGSLGLALWAPPGDGQEEARQETAPAETHLERGQRLLEEGDAAGAVAALDQALTLEPEAVEALLCRGRARLALEDHEDAAADFARGIALAPEEAGAWLGRGQANLARGSCRDAIVDLTQAISLGASLVEACRGRGRAWHTVGRDAPPAERGRCYAAAIADYDRALELEPSHAQTCVDRAWARYKLRDFAGARRDFTRGIEAGQVHPETFAGRGLARTRTNDHRGAVVDFTRSLELAPDQASTHFNRGNAHMELKEYPAAVRDFTRTLELNPEYQHAGRKRGTAWLLSREPARALEDFNRAIVLNPKDGHNYYLRGSAQRDLGEARAAALDYERCLGLQRGHPMGQELRRFIAQALGRASRY